LENIQFDFDKATLQAVSKPQLDELAAYLIAHKTFKLEIRGHTDSIGNSDHNQALSQQRANTIKAYLSSTGIEAERIHPIGFGSSKPIAPNDTEANRTMNRRVEIKITEN